MGADKPQAEKPDTKTHTPFPLILIGAVLLPVTIALFLKADFKGENEVPKLSPQDEAKLQKRLREIDEAQQYALIAIDAGWYPCNHPGRITYYLLPGEVWKYGTTTKGKIGRYGVNYLEGTNVFYIIQFRGTISECLAC